MKHEGKMKKGHRSESNSVGIATLIVVCVGILFRTPAVAQNAPEVIRFEHNPIIRPEMLPGDDGENINGPSLIRVPDWIEKPLGRYYLYFAHHVGKYIRFAYADSLTGPWTIYEPGTLRLEDTACNSIVPTKWADYKHVASPDVHVDDVFRKIRMYFHCPVYLSGSPEDFASYGQRTLVASSSDGIHFEAQSNPLGNAYFRVFRWQSSYYALGMPGIFYRSESGLNGFEEGPKLFTDDMRHTAVTVHGDSLFVFYTIVGENPERILLSRVYLSPDWVTWKETPPVVVLEPELEWEGVSLPAEPSAKGFAPGRVRQLRDPALYEEDGRTYLIYSVAGESGIAIAEILWQ